MSIDNLISLIAALFLAAIIIGVSVFILRGGSDEKLSRQQKRSRRIKVGGKSLNVLVYLRNISRILPPMYHRKTNQPIDHYKNLRKAYMTKGSMKDVDAYVDKVNKDVIRMARKQKIKIVKVKK